MINKTFFFITSFIFFSLFLIVPNFFLRLPLEQEFIKSLLLQIIVLFLLLLNLLKAKSQKITFSITTIDLFLGLFILAYIISTLLSMDKLQSIGNLLFTLSLALIFYLSRIYLSNIRRVAIFAALVVLGAIISFFIGVFEFNYTLSDIFYSRISGLSFHPVNFGAYLMIAFFLSFFLLFYFNTQKIKFLIIFLLSFLFFLIVVNRTRAVWFALFSSIMLVFTFLLILDKSFQNLFNKNLKKILLSAVLTITALSLFFYLFPAPLQRLTDVLDFNSNQSSTSIRLMEWKTAFSIIKNNVFFGKGPNSIQYTYPLFRSYKENDLADWQRKITSIRNVYLDYAANTGLVPLFLFILFLASIIFSSIKMIFKTEKNEKMAYAVILMAFLSLLIFFLFYHYTVTSAILFFTFAGILTGGRIGKIFSFTVFPVKYLLTPVIAVVLVYLLLVLKSEIDFSKARMRPNQQNNLENIKASLALTPFDTKKLKMLSYIELNYINNTDDAIRYAKEALTISPKSADLQSFMGYIYFKSYLLNNDKNLLSQVEPYVKKAYLLSPTDIFYADDLGEYYLAKGNLDKAEDMFRKELALKKDYYLAYYHLGEIYKQKRKFKEAKKWYEDSIKYGKSKNFEFVKAKIVEIEKLDKSFK